MTENERKTILGKTEVKEMYYRLDDIKYTTVPKSRTLSGIEELDYNTSGFEMGCITIWTGLTNAGKTTVISEDQEHLKCSTHSADKDSCSAHYIRTVVLKELVLNAMNKLLDSVKDNEAEFVQTAMDNSASKHSSDVFKAKKALNQAEKRIAELDRLFARLYEDNISGKISDERFAVLSA